jgi:hypothetical protein
MKKRLCVLAVFFVAAGSVLVGHADNYFFCEVGPNKSIQQEAWGLHAGIGGFQWAGDVLLFGGFGEYFGSESEGIHLGNGGAILGVGHVFGRRLLLGVEGVAGLGGGIVNQEPGPVYVFGANAFIGHHFAKKGYLGIGAGYRAIRRFDGFGDNEGSFDYLIVDLRTIFGPYHSKHY